MEFSQRTSAKLDAPHLKILRLISPTSKPNFWSGFNEGQHLELDKSFDQAIGTYLYHE